MSPLYDHASYRFALPSDIETNVVSDLNKKQKKQLDVERKKLAQLQLQLSGAKRQVDDPADVAGLQREIAATEARIEKLKQA